MNIQKEIIKKIEANDTIIIYRHIRPDPDALGSQCGLALLIKENYPEKTVYTSGEDVDNLSYLATMKPPKNKEDIKDALVIVTDTANVPRIDGGEEVLEGHEVIKIDHHPNVEPYGDLQWVDTNASSTSELITELWFEHAKDWTMTAEAARVIYGGMVGDTNRFLYDSTTPKTMRLAAELMEYDFSSTDLNYRMNELNPKVSKLVGYVLENLNISEEGVASIILDQDTLDQFSLEEKDTHQVVSLPGTIAGVVNWGVFVQQADGTYRCRLRSKGPVINQIAHEHDGGGHPLASGANAKDLDEIETILEKFKKVAIAYKNK